VDFSIEPLRPHLAAVQISSLPTYSNRFFQRHSPFFLTYFAFPGFQIVPEFRVQEYSFLPIMFVPFPFFLDVFKLTPHCRIPTTFPPLNRRRTLFSLTLPDSPSRGSEWHSFRACRLSFSSPYPRPLLMRSTNQLFRPISSFPMRLSVFFRSLVLLEFVRSPKWFCLFDLPFRWKCAYFPALPPSFFNWTLPDIQ